MSPYLLLLIISATLAGSYEALLPDSRRHSNMLGTSCTHDPLDGAGEPILEGPTTGKPHLDIKPYRASLPVSRFPKRPYHQRGFKQGEVFVGCKPPVYIFLLTHRPANLPFSLQNQTSYVQACSSYSLPPTQLIPLIAHARTLELS